MCVGLVHLYQLLLMQQQPSPHLQGPKPPLITNEHLSFIAIVQIVQVINGQPESDYSLGIIFKGKLVMLANEFNAGQKPGKAYLRRPGLEEPKVSTFYVDLGEESIQDYEELKLKREARPVGKSGIFVSFQLEGNPGKWKDPRLLPKQEFSYQGFLSGLAIGVKKSDSELKLIAESFDAQKTSNISLPLSVGVLIFTGLSKKSKEVQSLYGFYDGLDNKKERGNDYFLYEECLTADNKKQSCQYPNNLSQVPFPFKDPFKWIGLLEIPEDKYQAFGTASLLQSKDGTCKYIITCAHNFYGYHIIKDKAGITTDHKFYNWTGPEDLKKYKFFTAKQEAPHQPHRYLLQENYEFQIDEVYIPDQYKKYVRRFLKDKSSTHHSKDVNFPQVSSPGKIHPSLAKIIKKERLYDIAIAELKNPLVSKGFKIKQEEKQFEKINKLSVEVAGFPRSVPNLTTHKTMYFESTEKHDASYVRLSNQIAVGDEKDQKILKHKLSTLGGNSGSPIYERLKDQFYLFGIHTQGVFHKGDNVYGTHNYGTYLYSKNVLSWLKRIGIDQVFEN